MAVIAAKPQAENGRDRPPPGAPSTTPLNGNPRSQLHNSSSVRAIDCSRMGDDRCVLCPLFFFSFLPYRKSLTVNPDGAEAAHTTVASRAIDSRVLGTWEDPVGIPGTTQGTRALSGQLMSSMFLSVDLMRRKRSRLSSEVSGRVLVDTVRFDD